MAAINVSDLSDKELRTKLKEYRQNVGPITKSTRNIMEKKLQKLLQENQNEPAPKTTKQTTRRKSAGRKSVVPPASNTSSNNVNQSTTPPAPTVTKTRTRKSTNNVESNKKLAMFSSDEEEVSGKNYTPPIAPTHSIQTSPFGVQSPEVVLNKLPPTSTTRKTDTSRQSTIRYTGTSSKRSTDSSSSYENDPEPPLLLSYLSNAKTVRRSDFSDDDQSDLRVEADNNRNYSPFSKTTNNSRYARTSVLSSSNAARKEDNLSNFKPYSNSSNLRSVDSAVRPPANRFNESNYDNKIRDEIDASIKKVRRSFSSKKPSPVKLYDDYRNQVNNSKEKCDGREEEEDEEEDEDEEELDVVFGSKFSLFGLLKNKWTYFTLLLAVLCTVFAVWLYLYNDRLPPGIAASDFEQKKMFAAINCLFQYLSTKAGNVECGYDVNSSVQKDVLKNLECLRDLNVDDVFKEISSNYTINFELTDSTIASKTPLKSLKCRISTAVSVILKRIAILIGVILGALGFYYFLKRRWMVDDEETRQTLYYVDKILDILRRHHAICVTNKDIPPYLPIPHVRDMLIPLSSRKKMVKIWKKAVDFLNTSDSRVRVETQRVAGEDFAVWRWIGVATPKMKKEKRETKSQHLVYEHSKSWQGPAFDEIEKVVRMPIVPPTPCLKIRYMHEGPDEKDEHWVTKVKNAVLEKCQKDGAEILHIHVDKSSKEGCVYVKCDSLDSAGKSFRSMYGNWFDGRLIIVKFVTLARYHQRFPDSLRTSVPISCVTES